MSKAQINRTKNALRGLYNRVPMARDMQDIRLAAGEGKDLFPAVQEMVKDDELIVLQVNGAAYYDVGPNLKAYRLT